MIPALVIWGMGWLFWVGFTDLDPEMPLRGKALTFFAWPYLLGVEIKEKLSNSKVNEIEPDSRSVGEQTNG